MTEQFANLPVADLAQGENIRFELSEIEELAADIRRRGVLQAIVVIPSEDGEGAEVLIGHRRLAAAQLVGLKTIPCVLRKRESDVARLLDQVAENAQRVNLTPMEEARACGKLQESGAQPGQIAVQMQKSDTWVKNRIRLLSLPQCLQDAIHTGKVTAGRALDLPATEIRTDAQIENLARHLSKGGLSSWWRDHYARRNAQAATASAKAPPTTTRWEVGPGPNTPSKPTPREPQPTDVLAVMIRMERHWWERLDASIADEKPVDQWVAEFLQAIIEADEYDRGIGSDAAAGGSAIT